MWHGFSLKRLWAVIIKELIQMKRDRATLAMIIGIPLMQTILFGFAINSDPRHLPTAIVVRDESPMVRSLVQGMQNSGYFNIVKRVSNEHEAEDLLATGQVQFVLNIPESFSAKLIRQENPQLLLEADATDPAGVGNAIGVLRQMLSNVFQYDFTGSLDYLNLNMLYPQLVVHSKYNPAGITQYNIVTGLLGVVLTMTMVMITAIAITREYDLGTMETLLSKPLSPLEIMMGKVIPYIMLGYIQVTLILTSAKILFHVPFNGHIELLYILAFPFILANLSVGMTLSTLAKNPMQASQMAIFFYLPSLLLSGFMFPFRGMPHWAQSLGEVLPLTHFLRIVRGILLKGNSVSQLLWELVPILIFLSVILFIGVFRFRKTLD